MTVAVILAAGRSTRMGRPKALLPHAEPNTSFISYIVGQIRLAGIRDVLVVGRADDDALRDEVHAAGARLVVNPAPDDGQLSSLLCGLDTAEREHRAAAVLVMPVDVPLVTADVMRTLLTSAVTTQAPIVRATHRGRHGHPVIFKAAVFDELRRADPGAGARAVVRADPARVADVEVGDAGVTLDVDTPEDYRRVIGRDV